MVWPPPSWISRVTSVLGLALSAYWITAPTGGFSPGPFTWFVNASAIRQRMAGWIEKRWSGFSATAGDHSRTAVRSSRIQIDRPWVPTTRSSAFTTRSCTATVGRFSFSSRQVAPSSGEKDTPRSFPT